MGNGRVKWDREGNKVLDSNYLLSLAAHFFRYSTTTKKSCRESLGVRHRP